MNEPSSVTTIGAALMVIAILLASISSLIWLRIYRGIRVQRPHLPRHLALTYGLFALALATLFLEGSGVAPYWFESIAIVSVVAASMSWLGASFNIAQGEI